MKTFFTILISLFSFAVAAQIPEPAILWLKGYGGNGVDEVLSNVTTTQDGGFILNIESSSASGTGNIDSLCEPNHGTEIFLKYNADASVLEWTQCYQWSGDTFLLYLFPQNDGGNVLGGEYSSDYDWGFYICKQDPIGDIVWSHGYSEGNSAILRNMIATNDGGYIMIGNVYYTDTNFTIHNSGSLNADIGVLKVDSLGNKQWSVAIGGSEDDEAFTVIPGPDGGYYILGSTESSDGDCSGYHAGGSDAYLVRLDNNGNIIWHSDLGGSGYDGFYGWCAADDKGGVLIATGSNSSDGDVSHHIGGYDYWVLDVDSSNNILWNNCFGGSSMELPYNICKATDGSIWIAGESDGKGGEVDTGYSIAAYDAWFVHADSAGNFINAKVIGSSNDNEGYMVYPLSDGSVIAGGIYSDSNGSFSSISYYGEGDAFLAIFSPWTTGINNIGKQNNDSVVLFPNPANGLVEIKTTIQNNESYSIIINDLIGRRVYFENVPANITQVSVDVSGWAKEIYYVQVVNENGVMNVKKLLVE